MRVEERKLGLFVRHKGSLGVARESILRKSLIEQTPEPYKVKTGFIGLPLGDQLLTSDQCDILVYDPTIGQPFYRIDEFVVCPPGPSRLAIEVRSNVTVGEKGGLQQMFKVCKSMRPHFATQVFGFGYAGARFDTFVTAVAARVDKDIFNVPECIVVHQKNYICVRVTDRAAKGSPPPPDPRLCVAIDFATAGKRLRSAATALFFHFYHERTKHNAPFMLDMLGIYVRDWKLPTSAVRIIDENGTVASGPIPA